MKKYVFLVLILAGLSVQAFADDDCINPECKFRKVEESGNNGGVTDPLELDKNDGVTDPIETIRGGLPYDPEFIYE